MSSGWFFTLRGVWSWSLSCVDLLLHLLPFLGVKVVLWSNAPPWCVIVVALLGIGCLDLAVSFVCVPDLVLTCSCSCPPTLPQSQSCTLICRIPEVVIVVVSMDNIDMLLL